MSASRIAAIAAVMVVLRAAEGGEILPREAGREDSPSIGVFSKRTLVLALVVDREGIQVPRFTVKDRPFVRPIAIPEPRARVELGTVQVEVVLQGPDGARYTQRFDTEGLCLDHPPETESHVEGDRILLHRESLIVEVPEIGGFDRLEAAYYEPSESAGSRTRRILGTSVLDPDRFDPAGGGLTRESLLIRGASSGIGARAAAETTLGSVHWPEEYGDPDKLLVFGDPSEIDRRINIVIVPDGYMFAEKAVMQDHAQGLVDHFRSKTPYAEHDRFLNYILVYAYATQSGTDQCDCGIVRDTPMNTRFLNTVPTCGASENRCLFYGNASGICDPSTTTANITAAELRAPAVDRTVVMVNTTRYGGCGGARAVYSAGNAVAADIAAHELGHSLGNLRDEYVSFSGCGTSAGPINTSFNGVTGAWPEWIDDLGAPRQGAQLYSQCIYRPTNDCDMRSLNQPFCPVCNQQWALVFFSHFRVAPTAPISSFTPGSFVSTQVGQPVPFSVATRLADGPQIKNDILWAVQGPGDPGPVPVQSAGTARNHVFAAPGTHTLTCEVVADTNFIKPSRTAGNRDVRTWTVEAVSVPEVSDESAHLLTVEKNPAGGVDISFESTGSTRYNLYVSRAAGTLPFRVADPANGAKRCALSGVAPVGNGMNRVSGVDLEDGIGGGSDVLFFLVTADNGPGTEGPLGQSSSGEARSADSWCSH